jgi:hypothetical protein
MTDPFADAFSIKPGLCYRFVRAQGAQPQQCRQPVVWRGRHRGRNGRWHQVWSCEEHGEQLEARVRVIRTVDSSEVVAALHTD